MKNAGPQQFDDVTERAGISQLAAQYTSWGTTAQDFDNDGRDDIFVCPWRPGSPGPRSTRFSATSAR